METQQRQYVKFPVIVCLKSRNIICHFYAIQHFEEKHTKTCPLFYTDSYRAVQLCASVINTSLLVV